MLALYEDVHWADPTTLEALDLVIDRVRTLRALVVVTFRPEFAPRWTGDAHVNLLTLSRLGRRQGAAMVEQVTGGKALPPEVLEKVYRGWKSDMTHEYTPVMASLDRFVDFQKPAFRGLEALNIRW